MIFFIHSLFFLNSSGLSNIYSLLVPFLYKSRTIGSIGFLISFECFFFPGFTENWIFFILTYNCNISFDMIFI